MKKTPEKVNFQVVPPEALATIKFEKRYSKYTSALQALIDGAAAVSIPREAARNSMQRCAKDMGIEIQILGRANGNLYFGLKRKAGVVHGATPGQIEQLGKVMQNAIAKLEKPKSGPAVAIQQNQPVSHASAPEKTHPGPAGSPEEIILRALADGPKTAYDLSCTLEKAGAKKPEVPITNFLRPLVDRDQIVLHNKAWRLAA